MHVGRKIKLEISGNTLTHKPTIKYWPVYFCVFLLQHCNIKKQSGHILSKWVPINYKKIQDTQKSKKYFMIQSSHIIFSLFACLCLSTGRQSNNISGK